jgi:hypothetical protein
MRSPIPFVVLGLLSASLILPPAMPAQNTVHVGPMAGVSFAKFHGSDVGDQKTRTGFAAGGFAELAFHPNFALELQGLYVQKGAKAEADGIEGTFVLDYIEIPLLLKAIYVVEGTTRIAPNVFLGPAVGFKTRCKVKATSGGSTDEETCDNLALDIKSTDFSVVFGAGVDLGPVAVQGRYDLGLNKLQDVSPEVDVKTSAWIFTAGFRLPIGGQ